MRVLLADDHKLLMEGVRSLLEAHNIEVVGMARNGLEAVKQAGELYPDVILMDILMPGCDGLAATRLIKAQNPNARILILTTSADEKDLFEAIKSGACGYLLKSVEADELIEALEQVLQGIPPFSPGLAARLLEEFTRLAALSAEPPAPAPVVSGEELPVILTGRQTEVLDLVSRGLSYKEAGVRLNLSPRTIKYHMSEIMLQLHLQNRAQLMAYAIRMGFGPRPSG